MAQVFTVYNCGTGFNRERTDELIGYLGSITSGMQAKPNSVTPQDKWMICDGPGSSSEGYQSRRAHTWLRVVKETARERNRPWVGAKRQRMR